MWLALKVLEEGIQAQGVCEEEIRADRCKPGQEPQGAPGSLTHGWGLKEEGVQEARREGRAGQKR